MSMEPCLEAGFAPQCQVADKAMQNKKQKNKHKKDIHLHLSQLGPVILTCATDAPIKITHSLMGL